LCCGIAAIGVGSSSTHLQALSCLEGVSVLPMSWVEQSHWDALRPEQRQAFPPIAPDFVLELLSPSDRLATVQAKMQEYMASGVRLGWLIDPGSQQVEV